MPACRTTRHVACRALSERYAVEEITTRTFDPDFQRRTNLHHVFLLRHSS